MLAAAAKNIHQASKAWRT